MRIEKPERPEDLPPIHALLAQARVSGGWRPRPPDGEGARVRYDAFLRDHDLNGATVLQVGCGDAAFYEHLVASGVRCVYTGLDLSPRVTRAAAERFPEARFVTGYFLEHAPDWPYDFVVVFDLGWDRVRGLDDAVLHIARHAYGLSLRAAHLAFDQAPSEAAGRLRAMARGITKKATVRSDSVTLYR
ncbi:MAG: class I SAM-dependent methyltransferase [Armatimonadetes bacterium]|nr:class I SAM-dependent methyltransferase [Armatimonadota bacterium]